MTLVVRALAESDLAASERIRRVAFGTFLDAADPEAYRADVDYARSRYFADPSAALGAYMDGELVGSNFATRWGSFGFFGPLSVLPAYWNRGVGQALLGPTMELFDSWGVRLAGLYTFPNSPKHLALYQKFGFMPRFLTAIMSAPVAEPDGLHPASAGAGGLEIAGLLDSIYPGLDVMREIKAGYEHGLGSTVLVLGENRLQALAVCHRGPGTEAGNDVCYVKFAAVRPGPNVERWFDKLLDTCLWQAAQYRVGRLVVGVNTARERAYRRLLARGFRIDSTGIAMHRPNDPGFSRPDAFVLDDWR